MKKRDLEYLTALVAFAAWQGCGDDASKGGPSYACEIVVAGQRTCQEYYGSLGSPDSCAASGGKPLSACPEGASASCEYEDERGRYVGYGYGVDAETVEQGCQLLREAMSSPGDEPATGGSCTYRIEGDDASGVEVVNGRCTMVITEELPREERGTSEIRIGALQSETDYTKANLSSVYIDWTGSRRREPLSDVSFTEANAAMENESGQKIVPRFSIAISQGRDPARSGGQNLVGSWECDSASWNRSEVTSPAIGTFGVEVSGVEYAGDQVSRARVVVDATCSAREMSFHGEENFTWPAYGEVKLHLEAAFP